MRIDKPDHQRKESAPDAGFPDRLRSAIKASGMLHKAIASRCGIDPQRITEMLSGVRPGEKHLKKIAQVLDVTLEWLLKGPSITAIESQKPKRKKRSLRFRCGPGVGRAHGNLAVIARDSDAKMMAEMAESLYQHQLQNVGLPNSPQPESKISGLLVIPDTEMKMSEAECAYLYRLIVAEEGRLTQDHPLRLVLSSVKSKLINVQGGDYKLQFMMDGMEMIADRILDGRRGK